MKVIPPAAWSAHLLVVLLPASCGDTGPGFYDGAMCPFGYDTSQDQCGLQDRFFDAPSIETGVVAYGITVSDLEVPCQATACSVPNWQMAAAATATVLTETAAIEAEISPILTDPSNWITVPSGSASESYLPLGPLIICGKPLPQTETAVCQSLATESPRPIVWFRFATGLTDSSEVLGHDQEPIPAFDFTLNTFSGAVSCHEDC